MKKITTLLLAIFATFTMANADETTGQAVFDSKCVACHTLKMPENMKDMKAPPISKISARLKHAFDNNRTEVLDFIYDYIQNPSADKSKCMPMAIKKFGLMPPIGKAMSTEELKAVSEWMFDNFDEKWEKKCKTSDCKGMGSMKCADGKCAGDKAKGDMKCGKGKCSSEKKTSDNCHAKKCGGDKAKSEMKCGQGKCSSDKKPEHKCGDEKSSSQMKCAAGKCGGK